MFLIFSKRSPFIGIGSAYFFPPFMDRMSLSQRIGYITGPLTCLLLCLLAFDGLNPTAVKVIAVASWMIIWWLTEAVSISVTALIPLAL